MKTSSNHAWNLAVVITIFVGGFCAAAPSARAAEKSPRPAATYSTELDLAYLSAGTLSRAWVEFYEMGGLNHGAVTRGSVLIIPGFVKKVVAHLDAKKAVTAPR